MAELVDAPDSKFGDGDIVSVRARPSVCFCQRSNANGKLKLALAQVNPTAGFLNFNAELIIRRSISARDDQGAKVIVFPMMAATGHNLKGLLFRPELYQELSSVLSRIKKEVRDIYVVLGLPIKGNKEVINGAVIIYNGKVLNYFRAHVPLSTTCAFSECFSAINKPIPDTAILKIDNFILQFTLGNDLDLNSFSIKDQIGPKLTKVLINLSALVYKLAPVLPKVEKLTRIARKSQAWVLQSNLVGAQDELVFEGGSLAIDSTGKLISQAAFFREELLLITVNAKNKKTLISNHRLRTKPSELRLKLTYDALVLGIKDYFRKNHLKQAIVGCSGGIDSALTLTMAVDALGAERVTSVYLPSEYSSDLSERIFIHQAKLLDLKREIISIEQLFKMSKSGICSQWHSFSNAVTTESLQARIRALILMAIANDTGGVVLATTNRSELAVGYTTLCGDLCGGFAALKDVPKTLVYKLAKYRNKLSLAIPHAAITRSPTAELTYNQKDSDVLPSYQVLDKILDGYLVKGLTVSELIKFGIDKKVVSQVINLVHSNNYKYQQAPLGIRLSSSFLELGYPSGVAFKC